jgi:hypothetical protein
MSNKTKAYFMEVSDFKAFLGVKQLEIQVDINDATKMAAKAGPIWINVQKGIDFDQRMVIITDKLLPDGKPDWLQSCLINAKEGTRKYELLRVI